MGLEDSNIKPIITDDTVSISVFNGEVKVTPHTLSDSGWVEVEYLSSVLIDDIDVSFGFDGRHNITPTKVESWESYDHIKTKLVDAVVETTFTPTKLLSMKILEKSTEEETKIDIGDLKLNEFIAYIEYIIENPMMPNAENKTQTSTIAYNIYDEKTNSFTYKYNGQINEEHVETYEDWKHSNNLVEKYVNSVDNINDWKTIKSPQKISINTWHKMRFWVDIPFGGLEKISGK